MARRKKTPRGRAPAPPAGSDHPRLPACAAAAWAMLVRETEPMLPHAAVDWVRQEAECEDVAAVKRALCCAAANELGELLRRLRIDARWKRENTSTARATVLLSKGRIAAAWDEMKWLQGVHDSGYWFEWWTAWEATINRCRELEAA